MLSKTNKFKNKHSSKSKSGTAGSSAGSTTESTAGSSAGSTRGSSNQGYVYELLVDNGEKYEEAILHFVGKVVDDRAFEKLFRLRTVSRKGTVIFYIRHDNLYLIGFEIVGGKKYEFGRKGAKRLIEGSIFLEYEGSYRELEEVLLVNIRTDYWALGEAVSKLAEGKDRVDTGSWMNGIKKYLARAVVMFPESARFKWVFVTLVRLMKLGVSCPHAVVEPWMPDMIHGWEDISKIAADMSKIAVVGSDDDRKPPTEKTHLYTKEDVDNALKFWIWATDALVVPCLLKLPKETLHRRKMHDGTWWVSVKCADSAGAEEIVEDVWTGIKRRFPDYDDGFMYN